MLGVRRPIEFSYACLALLCFCLPWIGFLAPRAVGSFGAGIGLLLLVHGLVFDKSLQSRNYIDWWWIGLFSAWLWVALLWSIDLTFAAERVLKTSLYFVVGGFLLLVAKRWRDEDAFVFGYFLVAGTALGAALLGAHILFDGGMFALVNSDASVVDILDAANRPSVILLLCMGAVFVVLERLFSWKVGILTALFIFGLFFLTRSETAMLGGAVWLCVLLAATISAEKTLKVVAWGGGGLILLMPAIVLLVYYFSDGQVPQVRVGSAGARLEIWYAVAKKILEAPFLGHGIEAARFISDWDQEFLLYQGPHMSHPHNAILQLWLELGVVGALFSSVAWIRIVLASRQLISSHRPPILASGAAFLFILSVSHGLWQSWWVNAVFGVAALTILVARGSEAEHASRN